MALPLSLAIALLVAGAMPTGAHAAADARPAPAGRGLESVARHTDSLYEAGAHEQVLTLLAPHLRSARAGRDSIAVLWLLRREGQLRIRRGDVTLGAAAIDEAVQLAERLRDTLTLVNALRWKDFALQQQGRISQARPVAERMQRLARSIGDRVHDARAHISFGWYAVIDGDFRRARDEYARAADSLAALDEPNGEILARLGLGRSEFGLGNYRAARSSNLRALELSRIHVQSAYIAHALGNLAMIETTGGDLSLAAEYQRASYETYRRLGLFSQAAYPGADLASSLATLGRSNEALALLDTLLTACRDNGLRPQIPMVLSQIGRVRAEQGRLREAATAFSAAMDEPSAQIDVRAIAVTRLGMTFLAMNQPDSARALIARHLNSFEGKIGIAFLAWQHLVLAEAEYRLGHAAACRRWSERALTGGRTIAEGFVIANALTMLARVERDRGHTVAALALLDSAVTSWESGRSRSSAAEWRETLAIESRTLASEWLALTIVGESGSAARRTELAFDRLQRFKARTLIERTFGPRPSRRADRAGLQPVKLATLQLETLAPGELLLDFFIAADHAWLFAVTRDSCRLVTLPPRGLWRQLALARDVISQPAGEVRLDSLATRRVLATLGARLLDPVRDLLATQSRVFVIGDDALHLVPVGALMVDLGTGPEPLLAQREVSVLPAASLLADLRRIARGRTQVRQRGVVALGARDSSLRLAGARSELAWIGAHLNQARVLGRGGVVADLAGTAIVHFAGHTQPDDLRPWQTRLPGLRGADGEMLTAGEIAKLSLDADLVVLASCASVGNRVRSGEGVAGLASAFLAAGSPAVVASLWPVDDQATSRIVRRFYERLTLGDDAGRALARAQRSVRADPRTVHPFYWSGFVLLGDAALGVPVRMHPLLPNRVAAYAGGVSALLSLLLAWTSRDRRRLSGIPV
ncbi:MAG: CHAT domain-containing protein [Candidatus Eisenbacteria bacterium]|uniref:CHAT domain-containing protein n=1 Tax=Eiseniibacteriota bacterium TaxID=2212470 RepID=A0A849SPB1_UNCEI|nr:CHAT domain-containing protein [Candidatus Eisenbacteria bacterium]